MKFLGFSKAVQDHGLLSSTGKEDSMCGNVLKE